MKRATGLSLGHRKHWFEIKIMRVDGSEGGQNHLEEDGKIELSEIQCRWV